MQIRKTYKEVNPELLSAEIKDFIIRQGASPGESKLETYTLPDESANFISRSTMTFKTQGEPAVRIHIVGSVRTETKVMLDVEDKLFPKDKIDALMTDLDFMFGSYEIKS
ncbi:MAG: hypothetical protein PHR56_08055 [Dehalococcoidales bacterium]|nr:hypothetical protein [Dehalococcoidales bacterium]